MARALETPFAARPEALAAPVPGQDQALEQLEAAQRLPAAAPAPDPELQTLIEEFRAQEVQAQAAPDPKIQALVQEFQTQEVAPGTALTFGERAKFSFPTTEKEQRSFLEGLPGVTNVTKKGDDFTITREGKTQRVDPDEFEFFNDLFADLARPAVETVAAFGTEAALLPLAAGTVAASGGVAAPAVVPAVFAAGGAAADLAGNFVQEEILGIPIDPERSRVAEFGLSTIFSGVLGGLGNKFARSLERFGARKAEDLKNAASSSEKFRASADEFTVLADELAESGLDVTVTGVDGKPLRVAVSTLDQNTSEGKELASFLNRNETLKDIEFQFVRKGEETLDEFINLATDGNATSIKQFSELANRQPKIANKVGNFVNNIRDIEGKRIGEFKQRAGETLTDVPQAAPAIKGAVDDIAELLDIPADGDLIAGMNIEDFAERLGLEAESVAAKALKRQLAILQRGFERGGVRIAEVENAVRRLSPFFGTKSLREDKNLNRLFSAVTSAVREERRNIIEANLPQELKGQFRGAMRRFSEIQSSVDKFQTLLQTEGISSTKFIDSIFKSSRADAVPRFRALKGLLEKENPGLWDELNGELFNQAILEASKGGTQRPTMTGINTALRKIDPEIKQEIISRSPFKLKDLNNLFRFGERSEKALARGLKPGELEAITDGLIGITSPFRNAKLRSARNIIRAAFGKGDPEKLLSQAGLEKFIRTGNLEEKKTARMLLNVLRTTSKPVVRRPVEFGRRALEAEAREEAREE